MRKRSMAILVSALLSALLRTAPRPAILAAGATPAEVLRGVRAFFDRTARDDGSFQPGIDPDYLGMSDSAASDLAPVADAVIIHATFGWELPRTSATRELLLSRQREDGAFFNVRGAIDPESAQGRLYNTTQGLVALRALGVKPRHDPLPVFAAILEGDYKKLAADSTSFLPLAYLAQGSPFPGEADRRIRALMAQAADGYLNDPIAATFHAVHYYRLLGEETPRAEEILKRALRDQKPDGSWLINPPARDRHATFDAVFVLKQLGGDRSECREAIRRAAEWALTCRNPDGGFGHFPGSASDADAVYFHVGTLVMAGFLAPADPLPRDPQLLGWGHLFPLPGTSSGGEDGRADLIIHHGKIVSADRAFAIHEAMAVRDGRIFQLGSSAEVLKTGGPRSEMIDLDGKMVLPGLIDSHVHPASASMTEFDHTIPAMESIQDVLDCVRARAAALEKGTWIAVSQVFITRLREQRYPTREELDRAAPEHPVVFATGPDASLNTLAMNLSGIDKDFRVTDGGPGHAEKDPLTGEPTGILRSCTRYVKSVPAERAPAAEERLDRLRLLLRDYNSVGLTAIGDRDASADDIELYQKLLGAGDLSLRVSISHHIDTIGPIEEVLERIRKVATHPLRKGDSRLRIIGIKTYLDGGMLTGSAYMRKPWGVSRIYSITDPEYRGVLFIPRERLLPIVRTAVENGLQFTAHSVGDGAVHLLLDVYQEIDRTLPIRATRPCITHSNFMSREAVELLPKLGVVVDIQPAWLYLDSRTLLAQFGDERLRYFQPLRSIFEAGGIAGGGSDHMQKIGSLRSINPYNPFLGMWTTITRRSRWQDGALHPEEALSREQAIRFYTINNASILGLDSESGSLEEGKLADFAILDTDLLCCPVDTIREARVVATYVAGKRVYPR